MKCSRILVIGLLFVAFCFLGWQGITLFAAFGLSEWQLLITKTPPPVHGFYLFAILLLLGVLWRWHVQCIRRPLARLKDVLDRLSQGDLSARAPLRSKGAVGSLGQALSATAEKFEHRLQELESQWSQARAILESMVEGVLALDREGRILWLNGSAQRLFEIEAEEAADKRLTEVFRQPDLGEFVKEALIERRAIAREVHTFAPPERVIRVQAAPCEGADSQAALVLVAHDVTEIRRLEGVRREFVANVSHELKTPLTSIKGLVETLLGGALEDRANNRRFVTLIEEDATRLSRLIDDLLDLSQIESKALPLALQPVSLSALFDRLVPAFRRIIDEQRLALEVRIPPDLPPVRADPERLRQVFANLLDNALKFNTPGGRVSVSAAVVGSSMQVAIEDTGVGIPPKDLGRIFERFYRVDKARSRSLGGTGLGLSIVKHLVELHQGSISVESRLSGGSTFTIRLPLA